MLRVAEMFVDFGELCGKKGAAIELGEVRQVGIVGEKGAEFLPGRLGLDVGEVACRQFGTAKGGNPPPSPLPRGVGTHRLRNCCLIVVKLHDY